MMNFLTNASIGECLLIAFTFGVAIAAAVAFVIEKGDNNAVL